MTKVVDPAELTTYQQSYTARVLRFITSQEFHKSIPNPDVKHNIGSYLGEWYLWNVIAKYAENRVEEIRGQITEMKFDDSTKDPGTYETVTSPNFVFSTRVTEPVKRFSETKLCELLKASKYKVPELIMKDFIMRAKVPTKSTVMRFIHERVKEEKE